MLRRYEPLPPPSSLPSLKGFFPAAPPKLAIRIALGLRTALHRLADRVVPAHVVMLEQSTGAATTVVLGAVTRFGIADILRERGPLKAAAIADACKLHEDSVHRVLRLLAGNGVFHLASDGTFSNNRLSYTLCSGSLERTREWVLYFSSGSNLGAWLGLATTLQTGKGGFRAIHDQSVWEWFDAHPDERDMFAHTMMGLTVLDAAAIAKTYPFSEITTLCDIGGGRGTLLSEICLRHPHLRGTLCENAGLLDLARALFAERGLTERTTCEAGSFFETAPGGHDAYILKNILHDWDDAACIQILNVVRKAAKVDSKLLICELLVERNKVNPLGARSDVQMMVVCDEGRERDVEEFRVLLSKASYRLDRVFRSPTTSILEAVAIG